MNYLFHYPEFFNVNSFIAFLLSIAFSVSALFFYKKNESGTKILLFGTGVSIAYFACSLDLFLHPWDEQFHALVAKNLMNDPFNPVLFKNNFLTTSTHWTDSHTWLHKQPLFLWQMALSLKVFGVNEIALRIPNIIAHGFLAIMIFDIGKIIKNETLGILSSIILCYLKFPLIYAAGIEATDHNDYMFLFYVTASFWALFKYNTSKKIQNLILLGIFAGCAVMVKWLTRFIAIGIWGSYCLFFDRKNLLHSLLSFSIALSVCLPWQIYCYVKYRSLYLLEMSHNAKHFSEVVDGHSGPWYYHFNALKDLYANNNIIFFIIGASIILLIFDRKIIGLHKYIILSSISIVYIFFSFTQTRMPAFCMIVVPFIIIAVTNAIVALVELLKNEKIKKVAFVLIIPQLIILFFSPSYFIKRHTISYKPNEQDLTKYLAEKDQIMEYNKLYKGKKIVFINSKGLAVKLMFYTDHDATNHVPDQKTVDLLKSKHFTLLAFDSNLPERIINDPSIIKLVK